MQVAAVLERRQLQHVLATAMPQLRATTLGSTFSDPAALHRLWGLPQSQTAPSDQVAPHHLAPRSGSPIGSAADQQATVSGSFAAAAAAPANFPTPVMPIGNMGAAGPSTAGPYMRHTHKIFPGAAQIPVPVSQFPQSPMPQSQPTLFPAAGVQAAAPADLSQLSALMHGCPSAVALVDDFEPVLRLAESLAKSKMQNQNVREFVSWLYSSMFRIYSDERSREHMMNSLVQRATNFDSATAQASQSNTAADSKHSTDTPTSSGKSRAAAPAAAAASSASPASSSGSIQASQGGCGATLAPSTLASTGQQVHRGGAPGRVAGPDVLAPAGLLLQLVHQHHDAAPTALTLMLQQVQQQHAQVDIMHGPSPCFVTPPGRCGAY